MASSANYLDVIGALELVERIKTFWHSRGHKGVLVWAEPVFLAYHDGGRTPVAPVYQVRSNLSCGLPV